MGHRIELGEIETAMDKLPRFRRSLCIYDQQNKIVAFYEGDIDRKQSSRSLVKYVPNFMVPNVFVQVGCHASYKEWQDLTGKELTARYLGREDKWRIIILQKFIEDKNPTPSYVFDLDALAVHVNKIK